MRHRQDIDGLRALAIIPVVLFHARHAWFPGGFAGVDVFFVISGFLIARILVAEHEAGAFSIGGFYDRRVRRLLPAFFVFLICTAAAAYLLLLPSEMRVFARSSIAATLFVSNIFFWRSSSYFGPDADTAPLLHTWSLGVEEQYYVLFPIALAIVFRLGWSRFLPTLIVIAGAISLLLAEIIANRAPEAAFYLLPTRAWELLVGAWLACRRPGRPPTRSIANIAGLCGLLLVLAPMLLYTEHTRFPGIAALPVCSGTALLLWSGDRTRSWASDLLSLHPLVWVGRISYSLYLWHWPLLLFPQIVLQRDLAVHEIAAAISAAVIVSAFSWRYVEQPFRRPWLAFRGWTPRSTSIAASLAAIAATVLAFAPLLGGGPWRTPALVNQLDAEGVLPAPHSPCEAFLDRPGTCPSAAAPIVLLWGDSHAGHYRQALADLGRERGFEVREASRAGCAPLPDSRLYSAEGLFREDCVTFNRRVVQALRESGDVRLVVLSGRWNRFFFDKTDPEFMALGSTDGRPGAPEVLLERSLETTLSDLSRLGILSAVVGPSPEFLLPLPGCLARPAWQGTPARQCLPHPGTLPGGKGDVLVTHVLARHPEALGIRPFHSLCPRGRCPYTVQGTPILIDTDHLSYAAAAAVLRSARWPVLERQVR